MLKIGLTGGIGSGKSVVAQIFRTLGIPVFDADTASRKLLNEDENLKARIIRAFGDQSYNPDGLDRQYLAGKVFGHPENLALLNSIVHPATIRYADEWMAAQKAAYVIKEAALIFESGADKSLDYVIGVKTPLQLRIQRTMARDGVSEEQVRSRIKAQMKEDQKMNLCDFIIFNDENQMLLPQVLALHQTLRKLSGDTVQQF